MIIINSNYFYLMFIVTILNALQYFVFEKQRERTSLCVRVDGYTKNLGWVFLKKKAHHTHITHTRTYQRGTKRKL